MRKLSGLIAALLVLASCAELQNFLKTAIQEPTFAFKRLALGDLSLEGLTLDTVWSLSNPNPVGLSLASVDYALFIEDKQVVAGAPQKGLQIPASAATDLHFPASFKFQDIVAVVETFLGKETATYRAEGSVGVETPLGVIKLPLVHSGVFEVPKVPAIAFGNPRVSNLSVTGVTFEFPLTVTNKNTFAMPVAGVGGALTLDGQSLGTISTGNLGALDGKGTKVIALPLTVNFLSAGMGIFNAVQSGKAQVQFNAKLQSGATSVPLNLNQLVNFVK